MKKIILFLFLAPSMVNAQAPANDDACSATNLTVKTGGTAFCTDVNFDLLNSTYDPLYNAGPCPGNATPNKPDVWFKLTVPATTTGNVTIHTSVQPGSPYNDAIMKVYSSTGCPGLTYLNCNDDNGSLPFPNNYMPKLFLTGRTPGEVIYIQIYQFNGSTNGLFNICATSDLPLDLTTKVGIGLPSPDSTLDVNGNLLVRGGMRVTGNLKLNAGSPAAGKVLTSDAAGLASWQTPVSVGTGAINETLRNDGSGWVASSAVKNDGSKIIVTGFQMDIAGGYGQVLRRDANGIGSWAQPAYRIGAKAYHPTDFIVASGTGNRKLGFNNIMSGSIYGIADSTFTAFSAGTYVFVFKLLISPITSTTGAADFVLWKIAGGSASSLETFNIPSSVREFNFQGTSTINLNVGDKIYLAVSNTTGAPFTLKGTSSTLLENYFQGFFMYPN